MIGRLRLRNGVFLAPMAGITDLPFRTIVREFGCGLAFTEMVSANGLAPGERKNHAVTSILRPMTGRLAFSSSVPIRQPLSEAARIAAERGADLLDINMGCPVKKVVKTGSGAALMRDPQRVAAILGAVRGAVELPLTVKIRAGWSRREINAFDIGRIAEDCGVDAVTLHPRTVDQGFGGESDWGLIAVAQGATADPRDRER